VRRDEEIAPVKPLAFAVAGSSAASFYFMAFERSNNQYSERVSIKNPVRGDARHRSLY